MSDLEPRPAAAGTPAPPPPAPAPSAGVELTCECAAALDLAMEQNGVPVVREVIVAASGPDRVPASTLELQVEPGLSAPLRLPVPPLAPGEQHRLRPLDVPLTAGKLREILEAERGEVICRVLAGDAVLAERRTPLRVLAFNEWPGSAAPYGLLAAFVLPNHPVVSVLLQATREQLQAAQLPDALDGYQSRDRQRALQLVAALYRAIQALGLGYVGAPPSFERAGQKIRLPDAVLGEKLGCCLDLSVLFAAALEQMGLAPLVFLVRGHAFAGVWLEDERFPEGVVEDAARLRTLIELGQVLPLEATAVTGAPPIPFEQAVSAAIERLRDDEAFGCAVDVRAVRTEYRPLPIRAVRAPGSLDEVTAATCSVGPAARLLARAAALPLPAEPVPPSPPPPPDVALRFRRWKEKLLDLSLRNRLLNFRLDGKGALRLAIPELELLEDGVFAGKAFTLLPRPVSGPGDERDARLAERRLDDAARAQQLEDLRRFVVHTRYGADELWTRLKHLDREARTALEEGGAAVLYLAIGLLRWYETGSSEQPLLAPLLLYPVELGFEPRKRQARLRRLAEEPLLNVTLLERLRRDHGVDTRELEALPMEGVDGADGGVDVTELVRRYRGAVQRLSRWEVLEEAHLGLFQFTKFLMWKDLEDNAERFLGNPVVRRIASRETTPLDQGPLIAPHEVRHRSPAELPTVLDADSTQLAAMASALDGKSFVLQGPPGTGKSQTISNLVAASVANGRSVLFVSEKMAALEVVQRRLKDAGLGDFCLELHSHKAHKKQVVESLRVALEHAPRTPVDGWTSHARRLEEARTDLDRYVDALHRPGPLGPSVYDARARLLRLEQAPELALPDPWVAGLDTARLEQARAGVQELGALAAAVEPAAQHPFREARRAEWSAGAEESLRATLERARTALHSFEEARRALVAETVVEPGVSARVDDLAAAARATALPCGVGPAASAEWPERAHRLGEAIGLRRAAEARREALGARWEEGFLRMDHGPLARRYGRWAGAFFLLAWIMLWGARRQLRRVARGKLGQDASVLADLRAAAELAGWTARLREEATFASGLLGTPPDAPVAAWEAARAELDAAHPALLRLRAEGAAAAAALDRLSAPLTAERRGVVLAAGERAREAAAGLRAAEAELSAALALGPHALPSWERPDHPAQLAALLERWARGLRGFRAWCLYRASAARLEAAGLGAVVAAHEAGQVPSGRLEDAFERAVLRQWHARAVDADPVLRDFDAELHGRRVARFRDLDRAHLAASRQYVAGMLEARLPSAAAAQVASSEPAIIMREAQKKARLLPIRRLFASIPVTLRKLKPCFLMSPLSVAQYLPADAEPFDLVVFDEASQICTHDAIGAIARGRQVIVVGDSRQLPPTSFFTRTDSAEELPDDNDVEELESVLDEAVAKLIPQQWLGWHYRSRHESLIDFSNRHIYEGKLEVFPAAAFRSDDAGVHWRKVEGGVYRSGTGPEGRTNRPEAEALMAYLVGELKRHAPGDRTFGVVTFNQPQQALVLDLLDEARLDPEVDRHFTGLEPPFVKNLENVQGDERDEIVFSICSAPDATGRFSVSVGALNLAGGERRLNVAITRARRKLVVFSSIEPEQIDRSRSKARGIWLLRDFLTFARDGRRAAEGPRAGRGTSGDLEARIATHLAAEGWQVDAGVGCGGYRLDLAVRDPAAPGRYAVAVEADGPAYRAAHTARDRDRLRGEVLASLGWRVERVWSSAWWFDDRAPGRLVESVRGALAAGAPPAKAAPAPAAPAPAAQNEGSQQRPVVQAAPVAVPAPDPSYRAASLPPVFGSPDDFFAPAQDGLVLRQIGTVLEAEGPIHEKLLARRITERWGIGRLTANPLRRMAAMVERLERSGALVRRGEFLWPPQVVPSSWDVVRGAPPGEEAPRDLPMIPPEELANAGDRLLRDSGSMDRETFTREIARVFGVQRLGATVREALERGIEELVRSGRAEVKGERVQRKGTAG